MLVCITLFELFSVLILVLYLYKKFYNGGGICKLIILFAALFLSLIIGSQLASLYNTGHYTEVLTLSNIGSYEVVGRNVVLSSASIILICLILTIIAAAVSRKSLVRTVSLPAVLYCLFFCCVNPQGAVVIFGKTFSAFVSQSFFSPNARMRKLQQELYGKDYIFDNNLDAREIMDLRGKNIVVVFTEGFSAEWIDKFNKYHDLTPNLDRFLEQSVYFDNYYNHTAATFRGLRGQLTSSYQLRGGYTASDDGLGQISGESIRKTLTDSLVSIPHILKDNGYHSYFLSTHHHKWQLNQMLKTLEFDRVYGADDFEKKKSDKSMTDQQTFSALSDLVRNDKLQAPYFIGIYNFGTHLGQDSPDVKYGDGNNVLLNSIHNFDDAFGKFWTSVRNKEDLVVIFTADHAAYPSDLYNQTFKTHRQFFIDKIPFAVLYHGIKPVVIDAHGRNSLDFAPTLLQAMGIKHGFNYFLGCSLFASACPRKFEYITGIGDGFVETPALRGLDAGKPDDEEIIQKIKDFYNLSEDRRFL